MFVDGDSMAHEWEHEEINISEKDNVENVDLLCEAWMKKFSSKELFRKHQLTYIVIASQYEQCAKSFNTKIKLNDHMKTVHSKTSDNDCQKCGKEIKARKTWKYMKNIILKIVQCARKKFIQKPEKSWNITWHTLLLPFNMSNVQNHLTQK